MDTKDFDGLSTKTDGFHAKVDGFHARIDGFHAKVDWFHAKIDGFILKTANNEWFYTTIDGRLYTPAGWSSRASRKVNCIDTDELCIWNDKFALKLMNCLVEIMNFV